MGNYYNNNNFVKNVKIRSALFNTEFQLVEDGFDTLPDAELIPQPITAANLGGTADAITGITIPALNALTTNMIVRFVADASTTGASTFKLGTTLDTAIKTVDGSDTTAGTITSGAATALQYDGTYWQIIAGGSAATGSIDAAYTAHAASSQAHGVSSGAVVGTVATQTLTNKTLTSPAIDGSATGTGLEQILKNHFLI